MYYFYLTYLISYIFFSLFGLINDIFFPEFKLKKMSLADVKFHYVYVSDIVFKNLVINSIPIFVLCEILYSNYRDNITIIQYLSQYIITIVLGVNIEYLVYRLKDSHYFREYHTMKHDYSQSFGFMTHYEHKYDYYLTMLSVVFPALLRFHPDTFKSWIIIILYKKIILDVVNIKEFCLEFYLTPYIIDEDKLDNEDKLLNEYKLDNNVSLILKPIHYSNVISDNSVKSDNNDKHSNGHYSNSL